MTLLRRSSQRQLAPLSLLTRQPPCLHWQGDSGPVHSEKKPQRRSPPPLPLDPPILPVRALGGTGPDGGRTYQYWLFSSSDLYNWKAQNPPFSEDPSGLTDLFESILHTHSPTLDDCQQLLKTLFTHQGTGADSH
jgi:hypothetical protein